jgi:hypothetical protein
MIDEIYPTLLKSIHQGTVVQIEGIDNSGNKLLFLGNILFITSKFIKIKIPNDNDIISYLTTKPVFTVMFRRGGFLCQFSSSAQSFQGFPHFTMQINIPGRITSASLRKTQRISMSVNCKIRFFQLDGVTKNKLGNAIIIDLSINGMCISTPIAPPSKFILVKEVVLPDGSALKPFDVKIKSTLKKDKFNILSTQFIYISHEDRERINYFILKNFQHDV